METRGCRHLHFIAAIKSGAVVKLPNTSSSGKPVLRSKSLKDVYESEDAKRISEDYGVEGDTVKPEGLGRSCFPLADRTLRKEDFGSSEFVCKDYDGDDVGGGDDDDGGMSDDSLTLSQLKEIRERKKQKLSYGTCSKVKQVYDNFEFGEDEFDLTEPLVQWKKKLVKKPLKRKRKCISKRDIGSDVALVGMSEPIVGSSFNCADEDLMSLVCFEREYTESESFDVPTPIAFIDADGQQYDIEIPDEVLEGHAYKNHQLVLYEDRYQEDLPDSPEDIQIDGCDSFQQVLCIEECRNGAPNEEPIPLLEISDSNIDYVSEEIMSCQPHVVPSMPVSDTIKSDTMFSGSTRESVMLQNDQICHVSKTFNHSHVVDESSGQSSGSSGVKALAIAVNSKTEATGSLPSVTQSESFPLQQSVSSSHSNTCSSNDGESVSTNDGTVERDQSRACRSIDSSNDCWSPSDNFPSILPTRVKQPHETASTDSERGSSLRTPTFLDGYDLSTPVLQKPGRFTRKVISPTSQERICLALNSEELHSGADEYKCMDKLFVKGQTKTNPSIARSNIETAREDESTAQPDQPNRRKVVIRPSQIIQKAMNGKRGSMLKGNLEQPCYSRSLPCINTGCTSVTSCSKGAIAFSQRQMHDIDSLAGKLLNELNSMKDIVEQKLLLNSSRNLTLRNDADEVVEAIKTATKVEQNAKRLLSAMSRDCNRYCKIMSLTRDGPSPREDETHKEKRKIVFADEAGEMLCHVKFFDNGSSFQPLAEQPDNQNC